MGLFGGGPEWKEISKNLEKISEKAKKVEIESETLRRKSKRKEELNEFVGIFENIRENAEEIEEKSKVLKNLNKTVGQGKEFKELIKGEKSIKGVRKKGEEVRITVKVTARKASRRGHKDIEAICKRLYNSIEKINQLGEMIEGSKFKFEELREMRGRAWEVFKEGLGKLEGKKEKLTHDIKKGFERIIDKKEEVEKVANKKLKRAIKSLRKSIGEI